MNATLARRHRVGSRSVARGVVGLAIAARLAFDRSPLVVVAVLFVFLVPFERIFPRHRQRVRRPQLGTDVAYLLLAGPLGVIGAIVAVPVAVASLLWVPGLVLRPLVLALPPVPRTLAAVALFDLVSYWGHRFSHEVPFLWRFHSVHHSTGQLDWISGFRGHPLDGALVGPAFILLLAAGFTAKLSGVLLLIQLLSALFLHANVNWRLRPVQKVLATPEFHHWHHANEPEARNTNYAPLLPVWDLLFGTFHLPCERRPSVYGVDDPVPAGLLAQLHHPLIGAKAQLRLVRHPRAALRAWRRALGPSVQKVVSPIRRQSVHQ